MDLDKITVTIRPRSAWEGVDLGFTMARQWFLPLWMLWLSAALPLYLLAVLLFPDDPWLVILLVWWFKPLYEPLLLFWLSRTLFDEPPQIRTVLRQGLGIVWPQLLANLSWRRLSANRSFYMPVALLEQLKGKARKQRIGVLGRGQHAGTWLTLVGVHFEMVLELSFMVLLVVMLPEELRWIDLNEFIFTPGRLEEWLQHIGNILAMSLIAPFYVAGGFALYLTRRSELEAWDIEISFRRLMERRKTSAGTAACFALLFSLLVVLPVQDVSALQISHEEARESISEVLSHEDFGNKEMQSYWKYIGKKGGDANGSSSGWGWFWELLVDFFSGFGQGFALVAEFLLWICGGLVLAYLLYRISTNRGWLQWRSAKESRVQNRPVSLFGLDVTPESLPDDIAGAVRKLLDKGDLRGALSLLYRGSLVQFIHQYRLDIPDSATEGECLQLVMAERPDGEGDLFQQLTRLWIGLAYGHLMPSREQVEVLAREWSLFSSQEAENEG